MYLQKKRIKYHKKQTAEKGVTALPFEVVFFRDGDRTENGKGLSKNGTAAEGYQKHDQNETQGKRVLTLTQDICAVCHLQYAAKDTLKGFRGKRKEK